MVAEALARVVPLRGANSRRLVALHPSLAGRYTSLVAAVAPDVEAALSPFVLANRVVASCVDPPTLRLRPWRDERAAFSSRLARLAAGEGCLVFADVRDCYRSIRPDLVERSLASIGCDAGASSAVSAFLARLEEHGERGLPIGPDPSPVLANAVLAPLDRELAFLGVPHLRWVDDVVVGVGGRDQAERVLAVLRHELARLGLELNEDKTRVVVDPASAADVTTISLARRRVPVG
ncbi:MAG: RNA-directed DNA polymerase [Actinomycetota bacterium]